MRSMIALLLLLSPVARADVGYFIDLGFQPATVDLRTLYDELPDIDACLQGQLDAAQDRKALDAVNAVRALHGLTAVKWDGRSQPVAAKAALIIAASGQMTHHPPRSLPCWSSAGRAGSEQSNLYMGDFDGQRVPSTEYLVAGWLKDVGVEGLGHRRWLLDPTLRSISFARVENVKAHRYGAAMLVSDLAEALPAGAPEFIAWPHGRYPAFMWDARADWSVSMVDLPRAGEREGFDFFSRARVEVMDESTGRRADVSRLRVDTSAYGLPNLLSWRVSGARRDRWYRVRVSNVQLRDGATRELTWRVFIDAKPVSRTVSFGGVSWEQKTAAKSRDKFTFGEARRYCSSMSGRLPTLAELKKLVVPGQTFAVDTTLFPNLSPYANYWTSTPWKPGSDLLQVVAFWSNGSVHQQPQSMPGGVLCVVDPTR